MRDFLAGFLGVRIEGFFAVESAPLKATELTWSGT